MSHDPYIEVLLYVNQDEASRRAGIVNPTNFKTRAEEPTIEHAQNGCPPPTLPMSLYMELELKILPLTITIIGM
jgi:hypothetical protein